MKKLILPTLLLGAILLTFSCNRKTEQTVAEAPMVEKTVEAPREQRQKMTVAELVAKRLEGVALTADQQAQIDAMSAKVSIAGLGKEERQSVMKTLFQDIFRNVLTADQQTALRDANAARRKQREGDQEDKGGGGK